MNEVQYLLNILKIYPDYYRKEVVLNSVFDGTTALCKAIEKSDAEILRGLGKHSAVDINKTGKNITSLIYALTDRDPKKAQAVSLVLCSNLASKGLNVTTIDPITRHSPLHICSSQDLI